MGLFQCRCACYEGSRVIFYSQCHNQRRIGGVPAHQFFFGYDNDKDHEVCFTMAHVMYKWLQTDYTRFTYILYQNIMLKPNHAEKNPVFGHNYPVNKPSRIPCGSWITEATLFRLKNAQWAADHGMSTGYILCIGIKFWHIHVEIKESWTVCIQCMPWG